VHVAAVTAALLWIHGCKLLCSPKGGNKWGTCPVGILREPSLCTTLFPELSAGAEQISGACGWLIPQAEQQSGLQGAAQ